MHYNLKQIRHIRCKMNYIFHMFYFQRDSFQIHMMCIMTQIQNKISKLHCIQNIMKRSYHTILRDIIQCRYFQQSRFYQVGRLHILSQPNYMISNSYCMLYNDFQLLKIDHLHIYINKKLSMKKLKIKLRCTVFVTWAIAFQTTSFT
jgi:hypothetical protein